MEELTKTMRALDTKTVPTDYFTVINGNEAGVDLVLIQPFLLSYVNLVILIPTSIFQV